MATFTLRLKNVIEITGGQLTLENGVSKITGGNIGLDHYEIYDESYRDRLNGLIIDHYFNREIGTETVDMFQLAVRRHMNEVMPTFNELYRTKLIEFDPLSTLDIKSSSQMEAERKAKVNGVDSTTATSSGTNASNTDGTTNSTTTSSDTSDDNGTSDTTAQNVNSNRAISSDMPQTMLSGDEDYASGGTDVNGVLTASGSAEETKHHTGSGSSETDGTSTSATTGNETAESQSDGTSQTDSEGEESGTTATAASGYTGHAAVLLQQFRASIINIDIQVIESLESCFMQVHGNQDNFSTGGYWNGYYA